MSLLMEALRKAEAAKNKQEGKDPGPDNSLSLEPNEKTDTTTATALPDPADSTEDNESTDSIEQFEFSAGAAPTLEPLAVPEPESIDEESELEYFNPTADEQYHPEVDEDEDIIDKLDEKAGGVDELHGYFTDDSFDNDAETPLLAEQEEPEETVQAAEEVLLEDSDDNFEALEAAEELSEFERSKIRQTTTPEPVNQAVLDRQTANSLFQAKKNSQKSRRQRIVLLAALIALFPLGGGFYWIYSNTMSGPELFPGGVALNTNTAPPTNPVQADPNADAAVETVQADTLADVQPDTATPQNTLPITEPDDAAPPEAGNGSPVPLVADNTTQDSNPSSTTQSPFTPPAQQTPVTDSAIAEPLADIRLSRTSTRPAINPDLLAAYESYQQNDLAQAERLYAQVLELQPNNRDALLGLAIINRQQGNSTQAQALYSRMLQLNPRDPLARAGLLESGRNMSPSQQELELLNLRSDYPNVAPLAFALGNLYASQARWNEAQNAYFEALMIANETAPEAVSPDYAFNLAVSLERLNQLNLAYTYYQQALSLSASSPAGFNMQSLNRRLAYLEGLLE